MLNQKHLLVHPGNRLLQKSKIQLQYNFSCMKQLIFARHAKSSWDNCFCPDGDRWLSKRGKQDLQSMTEVVWKNIKKPDRMVVSPAKRAIKTAHAYGKIWWYKNKHIIQEPRIYEASLQTLLRIIESTHESVDRLMLVGHNPWLTELINYCGYELSNLPTCGVVVFSYTGKLRWNFEPKQCVFVAHYFPKEIHG